jgi:hypothetical protein
VKSFAVLKLEKDLKSLYNETVYAISVCEAAVEDVLDKKSDEVYI